jgi:alpha-ribazole phosphatase
VTVTTRWWWIRHAPVDNPEHRLYGQSDLEADTSDTGALRKLAAALPGDTVWLTSHLQRTRQTAEAVRPHYEALGKDAPPIAELPEIAEQDFGTWQGMTVGELKTHLGAAFAGFWHAPGEAEPPGGESFAQVIERVAGAIGHLGAAHSGRDIIAFAHGGSIRAALAVALDLGPSSALSITIDNLSLTRIDHILPGDDPPHGTVRPWRVHAVNQTA